MLRLILMFLASAVLAAFAATYNVTFCAEYQPALTDLAGGDYWTTNANQPAKGNWLVVQQPTSGIYYYQTWVSQFSGCATVPLPSGYPYRVQTKSKTFVNGYEVVAYPDGQNNLDTITFYGSYSPQSSTTVTLQVPSSILYSELAVGTYAMQRIDSSALGTTTMPRGTMTMYADTCCNAGANVNAGSFSKTIIAHGNGSAPSGAAAATISAGGLDI